MGSEQQPYEGYGMSQRGETQLVLLWRDPEVGYVYWELVGEVRPREAWARLVRIHADERAEELERWRIEEALSGRFVRVDQGRERYRAELGVVGSDGSFDVHIGSEVSEAPGRGPGQGAPRFVRVRLSERGLGWEPTEHAHPTLGRFLPGVGERPGSTTHGSEQTKRGDELHRGNA
ncbi:DUF4912 domain-containing protein [Bradymonadaceae bacterium TMQ3]|nr:DUF4912 domain-containing protein [Bradymonadaceae bacterium TMQ3]TXC74812.1 DUF4912 domain-containing protein [Bradymonadales bacterium TMQ1]